MSPLGGAERGREGSQGKIPFNGDPKSVWFHGDQRWVPQETGPGVEKGAENNGFVILPMKLFSSAVKSPSAAEGGQQHVWLEWFGVKQCHNSRISVASKRQNHPTKPGNVGREAACRTCLIEVIVFTVRVCSWLHRAFYFNYCGVAGH